jgi:hypothetical protein
MVNNSASDGSSQKFNLKNPLNQDAAYRLSFGGSWTFSDLGAFTNGGNTYADTFIYPNNSFLGRDNVSIWYYVRSVSNNGSLYSCLAGGNNGIKFELRSGAGDGAYQCLNSIEFGTGDGNTTKTGFLGLSRVSGTQFKRYGRGSLDFTYTSTSQVVQTTYPINIGCKYGSGSRGEFTNAPCSFAAVGVGFTDAESSALNTIIQTFQSALNRNIY